MYLEEVLPGVGDVAGAEAPRQEEAWLVCQGTAGGCAERPPWLLPCLFPGWLVPLQLCGRGLFWVLLSLGTLVERWEIPGSKPRMNRQWGQELGQILVGWESAMDCGGLVSSWQGSRDDALPWLIYNIWISSWVPVRSWGSRQPLSIKWWMDGWCQTCKGNDGRGSWDRHKPLHWLLLSSPVTFLCHLK